MQAIKANFSDGTIIGIDISMCNLNEEFLHFINLKNLLMSIENC